jgi:hypothetical protein
MLSRIAVIAVCIVAAMVAVKNGRVFHTAGLTGSTPARAASSPGGRT